MKNNSITAALVVLLALSLLSAALLTWSQKKHTQRARQWQQKAVEMQGAQNVLQQLANETVDYAKRNPAILPILQKYQILAGATPAAATAPNSAPKTTPKR